MPFCSSCGKNAGINPFCASCGSKIVTPQSQQENKVYCSTSCSYESGLRDIHDTNCPCHPDYFRTRRNRITDYRG